MQFGKSKIVKQKRYDNSSCFDENLFSLVGLFILVFPCHPHEKISTFVAVESPRIERQVALGINMTPSEAFTT